MNMQKKHRAAWAAASLVAAAALLTPLLAQSGAPGDPSAPPQPPPMDLTTVTPADAKSYFTAYGWVIGQRTGVKPLGLTADEIDEIAAGMKLAITSGAAPTDIPGGPDISEKVQSYLEARADQVTKASVAAQKDISDKFFADLDKNPNVKKTDSGLYYEIETPGTDPKPKPTDIVTVKYKGTFVDGKVFDQTDDKDPASATRDFAVDEVIPGWTEGLQLIGKGGKIKLYIPAKLGYGDRDVGGGAIPPGSTLVFETEIVDIKAPPPPSPTDAGNSLGLSPDVLKQLGQPPADTSTSK
jgi:FKBP-type peptidyl-prolyl cis-trans isomerase FkpA